MTKFAAFRKIALECEGGDVLLISLFQINAQLDIPIYQQLVDQIRAAVKKSVLVAGQQLPTVQELANELSLAKGTIKRAYDELEREGLIEKIQGRGTFIRRQPGQSGSRKELAMAAIDTMLDSLEGMGFSSTEIEIFLTLKLRERSEDLSAIRVAVVESTTENLSRMAQQVRTFQGVDVHSCLAENVRAYPYNLDETADLIVTTAQHAQFLEAMLPDQEKLLRVALRPTEQMVSALIRVKPAKRMVVFGSSPVFAEAVVAACKQYCVKPEIGEHQVFSRELSRDIVSGADYVLVPEFYERYCAAELLELLQIWESRGRLIRCAFEMDAGSLLFLAERLQQLQEKK